MARTIYLPPFGSLLFMYVAINEIRRRHRELEFVVEGTDVGAV